MSVSVKLTPDSSRNTVFDQPRTILVEGADDQAVVAAMIRNEGLEHFHVHDMKGSASWGDKLETIIRQPEFSMAVKALGLIKDADFDPKAAWDSCAGVLQRCTLPVPRRAAELAAGPISVAVMIVPSMSSTGAVEELCIASFDQAKLACVQGYFACLAPTDGTQASAKGRMQAYLAGLPTAPRDLKIAADRGKLDMKSSAFDELRSFVHALAAVGASATG